MEPKNNAGLHFVLAVFAFMAIANMVQVHLHGLHVFEREQDRHFSPESLRRPELNYLRESKQPGHPTVTVRKVNVRIPSQQSAISLDEDYVFTMHNGTKITFPSNATQFYSHRRYDRVGSALQDYFMAHAFAWHHGRKFAGACGPRSEQDNHILQTHMIDDLLGLKDEVPILDECPTGDPSAMYIDEDLYYKWKDTDIWTTAWVEYMQQQRRQEEDHMLSETKENTMVVHIRRGDVVPCDTYTIMRYLPNSHFKALIEKYRLQGCNRVIIHSERRSFEDWSDFEEIDGIELKLDAPPLDVWRDILNADTYIMSKSSFSLVPALFTKASHVVYTPFWHRPQPHWERVDNELMHKTDEEVKRLREQCETVYDSREPKPLKMRNTMAAAAKVTSQRVCNNPNGCKPTTR